MSPVVAAFLILLGPLGIHTPQQSAITAEDLAVIDAALDHGARKAERGPRLLLLRNRTLALCGDERVPDTCIPPDDQTREYVLRVMKEVTPERFAALLARNAVSQTLTAAPAGDVILVSPGGVGAAMSTHGANVSAFTSLPVYFPDGSALLYMGYYCGALCGEGHFFLLRRTDARWRVVKTAMTWIS